MPRTFSTRVSLPPTAWLKEVLDRKLEVTGVNVWKALRYPSFVQVISRKGDVMTEVSRLSEVADFRITRRGQDFLEEFESTVLKFKKHDPPANIRYWLSTFRRLIRNCPEGIKLTFSDGELKVLAEDTKGNTKNDDLHLVESVKVPWLSI